MVLHSLKRFSCVGSLLAGLCATPILAADPEPATLDELVRSAEDWARENLDPEVLEAFQSGDRQKIEKLFRDLQTRFQGEYVIDVAALKEGVQTVLPLLEGYEETLPYAIWLRARLDYFEVADEFRKTTPAPRVVPGEPPKAAPNPSPTAERALWIRKVSKRPLPKGAASLVTRLKPLFIAEGVPSQLIWIAEIESSFDPRARSPAGAVGLFQLMPETAKRFQLSTRWPDERLDPEPSARAAARYLAFLQGKFKDWRLATAAYNCGEGTVQRALDRSKTKTFDGIATRLPAETQLYVPKLEATLLEREGIKLETLRLPASKAPGK